MRAKLTFDLSDPDDRNEFTRCTKATDAYIALWDIGQEIFRPHRKHGYSDSRVQELIDKCPTFKTKDGETDYCSEVIEKLEEMFYEILREHGINLDEELN